MRVLVESDQSREQRLASQFSAWYQSAFDSLTDGIGLLDVWEREPPRLLVSNPAFDRMAGLTPGGNGAIPIHEIADSRFAAAIANTCERCAANDVPAVGCYEVGNTERRIYELSGIPYKIYQDRHRLITILSRDITESETLKTTMHARAEEFHALIEHAPDLIARYDTQGRILYANQTVRRDGPADPSTSIGRTSTEISPNSQGARRFHECVLEVARTGEPAELYVNVDALESNPQAWHQVRFVAEHDQHGKVVSVLGIGRDLTKQRNLERALLDVANREQLRLGSELHDGLGQELTGLSLMAAALATTTRQGGAPTAEALDRIAEIAANAIATCREIARGLTPLAALDGALIQGLRTLASVQRRLHGTDVDFDLTQTAALNLTPTAMDHLYRIAQEGLTNARKHANAGSILISIDIQPDFVRLSIIDDGDGMPAMTDADRGLGLMTMHYRASIIGARLTIEPGATRGTRLTCECPQRV